MEAPELRVRLLGRFEVTVGDRVIPEAAWTRKKAMHIVKLLALSSGQRLHREQVLDRLWPEHDLPNGLNNLHRTLHVARRVLTPHLSPGASAPFLRFQGEVLSLDERGPVWMDAEVMLALLSRARADRDPALYARATALYGGELLPGDVYEDWTLAPRERLRALHLEGLLDWASCLEEAGDLGGAASALEQATHLDPTAEAACSALMRLRVWLDQPAEALRQYQHLRAALRDALDVEPSAATRALYEEVLAGQRQAAQPSPAVTSTPLHLPEAVTPFLGRVHELGELPQLLEYTRLLTVVGPGGVGKSRVALELARQVRSVFPDGVWWVPLAALADGARVPSTVAGVTGVTVRPGDDPLEVLGQEWVARRVLLVLDNCEHLLAACGQLAARLLAACPGVTLLATSREPLHVAGEIAWRLAPLAVPAPTPPPLPELLALDSVVLFRERARRASPTFEVGEANAALVTRLCRQLDGLPLALELAAAQVGLLPLPQIVARLEDSLRLLVRGARDARPEHHTLEAALTWSHALLTPEERDVFRQLAVFAGGWTVEAAEDVCVAGGPRSVVDVLAALVDKSLVEGPTEGGRYRLLEPTRQYAERHLMGGSDEVEVRERHLRWHLHLAETANAALYGQEQKRWLDILEGEHDNLRAALRHGTAGGETELGLRLATALWRFWEIHDHVDEGVHWLEVSLAQTLGAAPRLRAAALNAAGNLDRDARRLDRARAHHEASLTLRRQLGDSLGVGMSLNNLAMVAGDQGDYPSMDARGREALAIFQALQAEWQVANTTMVLGRASWLMGDLATSERLYREALGHARQVGDTRNLASLYANLAEVLLALGDPEQAWSLAGQGLALQQELGSAWDSAVSRRILGHVALALGRPREAQALLTEALTHFQQRGMEEAAASCLVGLAGAAANQGCWSRAGAVLAAAEVLVSRNSVPPAPAEARAMQALGMRVQDALGDRAWQAARRACQVWSLERLLATAHDGEDEVRAR